MPARYDEGTIATNHNAATGERGTITQRLVETSKTRNADVYRQSSILLYAFDAVFTFLAERSGFIYK